MKHPGTEPIVIMSWLVVRLTHVYLFAIAGADELDVHVCGMGVRA